MQLRKLNQKISYNFTQSSLDQIFVVCEQGTTSKDQLELILLKLGIKPIFIGHKNNTELATIGSLQEVNNRVKRKPKFGIVLLTPDDMGYSKSKGIKSAQPRAKQDVIYEMGRLSSTIGLKNTIVIKKGILEMPLNTLTLSFNKHINEITPNLIYRLNVFGFNIKTKRILNVLL